MPTVLHALVPLLFAVMTGVSAADDPHPASVPPPAHGEPPGSAGETAADEEPDGPEESPDPEESTDPETATDILWSERVAVSAEVLGPGSEPINVNATVLDPTKSGGTPSTVAAVVTEVPGVSENGQGGHFQVFSIRGISRHRVQNLVSGMRINSERRAGASVSFVDPMLMDSVKVLRGPSTTTHGSGALGGAVDLSLHSFTSWSVRAGYDSRGDENYQVLGYGDGGWSVGFARRAANDARAGDGSRLNTHFTQYSATLSRVWGKDARRYEILFLPTLAEDVGKSNTDYPERTTNYPRERHQMLKFSVDSEKGWRSHVYLHAQDLETDVVEQNVSHSQVFNESLDYGVRWDRDHDLSEGVVLNWGLEATGRHGVSADETRESLDPAGPPTVEESSSLDDARAIEAGAFTNVLWKRGRTEYQVGGRVSWIDQENAGAPGRDDAGLNGFAGASRRIGERFELRGSLGTGIRFPSLSERFFTGTTGAGGIVGNPDLDAERSLNAEISVRWLGRKLLINGGLFRNAIDDYIERVRVPGTEDLLTFENLTSGTIQGGELQGLFLPVENWRVSFGGQYLRGRSDDDEPLADVPAHELYLGFAHHRGPWTFEARLTHRADKTDPALGTELSRSAAEIFNATVGRRLTETWWLTLTGSNVFDETYFPSADRKAALAPGGSVGLHIVRSVP